MNTFFSDKIILWQKMAKIWLKSGSKLKKMAQKKNQTGENGGERKKNPSANPATRYIFKSQSWKILTSLEMCETDH